MQKRLLKRLPERGVPAQPPTAIIGPFGNRRAIAVILLTTVKLDWTGIEDDGSMGNLVGRNAGKEV